VAILRDREPLGVVLLTVVVDQTHQPVTALDAKASEHAADIDRTVLIRIADKTDGPTGSTNMGREPGKVTGADHRRLIDDHHRPARQAGRVPVAEVPQQPSDGGCGGAGRAVVLPATALLYARSVPFDPTRR
jgi:hypothetical protein